jgi:hypothetical protein
MLAEWFPKQDANKIFNGTLMSLVLINMHLCIKCVFFNIVHTSTVCMLRLPFYPFCPAQCKEVSSPLWLLINLDQ